MTEITVDHVKDVWEAFSTLSDAQEMVENKEWERANDLINHSKLHLMRMMGTVPALRREAMSHQSPSQADSCYLADGILRTGEIHD